MLLEIEHLVAGYGEGRVLDGLSMTVGRGERVGILGRNGAGKTTLLRTIMGVLAARAGDIRLSGTSLLGRPPHRIARLGIGYVPQGREIFSSFTVLDNLRLGNLRRSDFEPLFEWFPVLRERRNVPAGTLSGGQQQQLAIARALAGRPRLLLLDEPSEGIQPSIVREITGRLRQIARQTGMTLLLIEQNVEMVLELCDRILFLENGRLAADHPRRELERRPALLEQLLGL